MELLGHPIGAEAMFPPMPDDEHPHVDELSEEHRRVLLNMQHYVNLYYSGGTDLTGVESRLLADERFAYAGIDRGGGFSRFPNDPRFRPFGFGPHPPAENFQWNLWQGDLALPGAWDHNTGWAHVGILDGGVPAASAPGLDPPYTIDHNDLFQVVSKNHSWRFWAAGTGQIGPNLAQNSIYKPHGTHVLGIVAANADNGIGTAGVCWNCSVLIGDISNHGVHVPQGITWFSYWGAQAINFSGFIRTVGPGYPCELYDYGPASAPTCQALGLAKVLETNVIVASGNDKGPVNFPASDTSVISVGGSDIQGNFWDEQLWLDLWDYMPPDYRAGCPRQDLLGYVYPEECGSNSGPEQHFVAPSRRILSTVPYGAQYSPYSPFDDYCNDANFGANNDGIAYCTGTSMAAPQVTGSVALVRSVNPLLGRVATFNALKETASNSSFHDPQLGWGRPIASEAVKRALGNVGGIPARNHLTPMFALTIDRPESGGAPNTRDRLYTTRPQVVAGAFSGWYLAYPRQCLAGSPDCGTPTSIQTPRHYQSVPASEASSVAGYSQYPGYSGSDKVVVRASFWVFTSNYSPWSSSSAPMHLKPLYRLSFRHPCDWRDHVYTTEQAGINYFTQTDFCSDPDIQSFQLDGIEGYVLEICPPEMTCDGNDPTEPQKLYRRYSFVEDRNALILHSQLGTAPFVTYTSDPWGGGDGFLGYVYPNIDSDGDTLPDGMERMLGMNPLSTDSDCDGIPDHIEFPLAQLQPVGTGPLLGGTCP